MSSHTIIPDQLNQQLYPHLLKGAMKPGDPCRNPYGRPRYKLLSDAMARKLEAKTADGEETQADKIADKMVQLAVAGDVSSVIVLRDSTEGRPAQQITMDTTISFESADERRARLFLMMQALAGPQEVEP